MVKSYLPEDEASLYVLGRLGEAERHEFEARLEKSAELRALVCELEAGAVALTLAMPQREPPAEVWRWIENAAAQEMNRKVLSPPFWTVWLRNGWAAAAACLLGWMLYAFWMNRIGSTVTSPLSISGEPSQAEVSPTDSARNETVRTLPQPPIGTNVAAPSPQLSLSAKGQIAGLHRQVADLETQVAHLSQMITQQQALLSEPGRLKFFQLLPPNPVDGTGAAAAPPSPAAQRALLLAIARELGWLPSSTGSSGQESFQNTDTNGLGVDFVDLPSAGKDQPHDSTTHSGTGESSSEKNLHAQAGTTGGNQTDATAASGSFSGGTIPGVLSPNADGRTDALVAFDTSGLSAGTLFTVWGTSDGTDGPQNLGTFPTTGNPMVLRVNNVNSIGLSVGTIFIGPANAGASSSPVINAP